MRRFLLIICLLTLLGCSGLTSLVVVNNIGEDATVRVWTVEHPRRQRPEKDKTFEMGHGDRVAEVAWFRDAPKQITLEASWTKGSIKKAWTHSTYPPGMAKGSSGGGFYVLEINREGAKMREPNYLDRFYYNPGPFLLLLCPIVAIGLILWVLIRAARQAKRSTPRNPEPLVAE